MPKASALTVSAIKKLRHSGTSYTSHDGRRVYRREVAWDADVPGLGLRPLPSGRKAWVLRYRVRGRQRIVVLGAFGAITLEAARRIAQKRLARLADTSEDPCSRRERGETVGAFVPVYLEHARQNVKASSAATYAGALRAVVADLGGSPVDELSEAEVRRAFARWTERRGRYAANRSLQALASLLDLAGERGLRPRSAPNPARLVKRNREGRSERVLTGEELERVGRELEAEERARPDAADAVAAVRLLLLTGARRREITELAWAHVDLAAGLLRLRESKSGPKAIPLNIGARELLASLPRDASSPRVFPSGRHRVEYAVQHTWARVRARAGCSDVRLHDLRHTWATFATAANYSTAIVGKALGHRSEQSTRRYQHLGIADPVREMVERVGGEIAASLEGRPPAEVVKLERG
jgi:integrase